MAQQKGRKIQVSVSTDDTAYNAVGEMNSVEMNMQGNTLDVTAFGDDDVARILGLRDCSWSLSGWYDPTDATGQIAIRDALLNDTPLYVKVLLAPTATAGLQGFKQQVIPATYNPKGAVAEVIAVDFALDGSGPVTAV